LRHLLVRYHEIALKGRNRPMFVRQLVRNLSKATKGLGAASPRSLTGRIEIELDDGCSQNEVIERVSKVFGIANFSVGGRTECDLKSLKESVGKEITNMSFKSFKVDARRADKSFPVTSQEINKEVGAYLKDLSGAKVDLESPDLTVTIEVIPRAAYYYFKKLPGPGGLPVGVSGRVLSLISGGIDSPVAAYRMMKRGCRVIFVHFHSHPFLDKTSQEKAIELVVLLTRHQYSSRLYLVPFGEIQREIVISVPAGFRVIIYRRLMMKIAGEIACNEGAKALVTGESLGQVASQTLENMTCIEKVSSVPILRPLVGMDKDEISREAKGIGTYEASIVPDQDCCQLFVPKHPATRASIEDVEKAERKLDVPGLLKMGLERAVMHHFGFP